MNIRAAVFLTLITSCSLAAAQTHAGSPGAAPTRKLPVDILPDNEGYAEALRHHDLAEFSNQGRRLSIEGVLITAQLIQEPETVGHATTRSDRLAGADAEPFIIVRENNFADALPERFRSSDAPPALPEDQLTGLSELNVMGGGQPSETQLRNIIRESSKPLIVLDLRQEPHAHIGGMPVTWFRPYISDQVLGTDAMLSMEDEFVDFLRRTPSVQVDSVAWTGGQDYDVLRSDNVSNETAVRNAEMVERNGAQYLRYHIPVIPDDQQLAEFERFAAEVAEQDVTVYFHCWDGTGRSTEFMVMYDILRNGRTISLETIANRHAAMGGINVLDLPAESSPNYSRSVMRRDFIIDYYQKKSQPD